MNAIATTRILHTPETPDLRGQRIPWVWPLPSLDGLTPCILVPFDAALSSRVEIGYSDQPSAQRVQVFATQSGVVAYAGTLGGSSTICIDHAGAWSTQYDNLEDVSVRPTDRFRRRRRERVRAGDVIGHVPRARLRIGFALSRWTDSGLDIVDPETWMPAWSVLAWFSNASHARPRSKLSA